MKEISVVLKVIILRLIRITYSRFISLNFEGVLLEKPTLFDHYFSISHTICIVANRPENYILYMLTRNSYARTSIKNNFHLNNCKCNIAV